MLRITPEMVVEAYEKTGLTPMQGDYFPDVGCACALGAISASQGNEDPEDYCARVYNEKYFRSFACGFDGTRDDFHNDLGYQDGKAAWEAVKKLGDAS